MVEKDLWTLEERFWRGDAEFYERNLAAESWMIFPNPLGMLDRRKTLDSIKAAPRWDTVDMGSRHLGFPARQVAVLVYAVTARRTSAGAPYSALCSSTYVEAAGKWRLVLHQQTPVESH